MNPEKISLIFDIMPVAVQSVRHRSCGNFIRNYQPEKVVKYKRTLRYLAKQQLPDDFTPWDCPLALEVDFIFPAPKAFSRKKIEAIKNGTIFYKDTRPDLQDNLMKAACDALTGLLWTDDSKICLNYKRKIYGITPQIRMTIYPL